MIHCWWSPGNRSSSSWQPYRWHESTGIGMISIIKQTQDHYCDVKMGAMVSQITSLTSVYSTVYSGADQRKHQTFASLAFVWGIHQWPVDSPHKWAVTRKMIPFDDVITIACTFMLGYTSYILKTFCIDLNFLFIIITFLITDLSKNADWQYESTSFC